MSIVAINNTPVIEPDIDQLSVGDHIESQYVYKGGWVQLWKGIVLSIDPDAECRAGTSTSTPKDTGATNAEKPGAGAGEPTSKPERSKGKSKRPKRLSNSPPEADARSGVPQQKRRRGMLVCQHWVAFRFSA